VLTPQRTDARRNRESILRVADEAFARGSESVSLEEVARRAGLGRATVYRHFPDRQALGNAVAEQQLELLKELVRTADGDRGSFRDLLRVVLSTQVARRPLVQLFRELPTRVQRQSAHALIGILTPAFRRAQAAGELRDDLEPADLVLVLEMVEAAVAATPPEADRDATAQRFITFLLDGLFPRAVQR
jgi:AcrR family transcriptional regulator